MERSRPTHVSEHTVGMPISTRGKQNVHFSALPVGWSKYTFLYGQPVTHIRQPRHRCWSTSTLPPASESSQLADQEILMSRPVSNDFGRATGVWSPAGAVIRCS